MIDFEKFRNTGIPVFEKDSTVCFMGDSHVGDSPWVYHIFQYYSQIRPELKIKVYDCGIGGGTADYGIGVLDEDVLRHNPTHVVIEYGSNDMTHFKSDPSGCRESFYRNMRELSEKLISKGIKVSYMTVPFYEGALMNDRRVFEAIRSVDLSLAEEFGTHVCDLYLMMSPLLHDLEFYDSDRVHFNSKGSTVIAKLFLLSQGFDVELPGSEDFFKIPELTFEMDHKMIFSSKIRRIRLAERNIGIKGDTASEKIEYLKGRIRTRADGAWDEFCYYRAVDFIELYPLIDFYYEEMVSTTELIANGGKIEHNT